MNKRTLILLSLCALLLPMLFACGGKPAAETSQSTDANTTAEPTASTTEPNTEPRWHELMDGNSPLYNIVRPDEDNVTTTMAMIAISDTLKKVTGKSFRTGTDLIIPSQGIPDRYEILIGNTNREETAAVMAELSEDKPFAICQIDKRIVLVGLTDKDLAAAVEQFLLDYTGQQVAIDYLSEQTSADATPIMPQTPLQVATPDFTVPTDIRTGRILSEYDTLYDIVADVNVLAYGAVGDGKHDDTEAFRAAIAAVQAMGGGTVYAPKGYYRLSDSLTLPALVTLAGDLKPGTAEGTVLCIYGGKGETDRAKSAIICGPHASVQNIAFWYPEQTLTDGQVIPYPAAINQNYINGLTVRNVTFVNAYRGIDAVQAGAVLALEYLRDICGTCLDFGYYNDYNLDIGKLENFRLSPNYWLESGLPGTPDEKALRTYMLRNSVGIRMGQADFFYFSDIRVEGYRAGMYFETSVSNTSGNAVANGQILNPMLLDCYYPIYVNNVSWFKITGGELHAVGNEGAAAIYFERGVGATSGTHQAGNLYFTNTKISSDGAGAIVNNSISPKTLFYNCTIRSALGSAVIANSNASYDFINTTVESGNNRIYESYTDDSLVKAENVDTLAFAKVTKPASDHFIDLSEAPYHVKSGEEISTALQNAIDSLRGIGGMVYLPAGIYYVNEHIDLWAGIELRGSTVTAHVDMFFSPIAAGEAKTEGGTNPYREVGTVIYTNFGKNDPEGKEFIAMYEGSGIMGLSIEYPEQDSRAITPYSFTIRGFGKDIYIIDVGMSSADNGIDFASAKCDNHYVEFLWSVGLNVGIQVGAGSEGGIIRDCHYTVNCWQIGRYRDGNYWNNVETVAGSKGRTFVIGESNGEVLFNNFSINQLKGISLLDGAQNVLSVGSAVDYSDVDVYLDGNCTATIINGQFVMGRSEREISLHLSTVYSTAEFSGHVNFFNCAHWGRSHYTYNHNGTGEIFSVLSHTDSNTNYIAFANVARGSATFVSPVSTRYAIPFTGESEAKSLRVIHGISSKGVSIDKKLPEQVVTVIKKN